MLAMLDLTAIAVCLSLVVAVLVWARDRRALPAYVAALLLVATWAACAYVGSDPAVPMTTAHLAARGTWCAQICSIVALLWLSATFPAPSKWYRWLAALMALAGCVWAVIAWQPPYTGNSFMWDKGVALFTQNFAMLYVAWHSVALATCAGRAAFLIPRTTGRARSQARFLFLAVGVLLPVLLYPIAEVALLGIIELPPLAPFWCALALGVIGYMLCARQLQTPGTASRPWLTYGATLTAGIWLLSTYMPQWAILLTGRLGLGYHAVRLMEAIMLTVSTLLVKILLDIALDYLLYRQHYDHPRAVLESATDMADAADRVGVLQTLTEALARTVAPTQFALLVPGEDGKFAPVERWGASEAIPGTLPADGPLVANLRHGGIALAEGRKARANGGPAVIKQLREWQVALALGMEAGGTLHGIILLGEKRSSDAYTREELVLLQTMAHQAALALESAKNCGALQELNAHLEERVQARTTELADANQQLAEAVADLQVANRHKDEFLAFTSHELLTPVTVIVSWAELAKDTEDLARKQQALEMILQSAWREERLVKDLLNISRLIHGKVTLECGPTDLWQLAAQSAEAVAHVAAQRELTITLQPPTLAMPIHADEGRLLQVIGNLLNNAMKFTDAGGQITVRGRRDGEMVELAIQDTGRGMPAEQLERIFQPFAQVHRHETGGGLGIGLALVKGYVDLHGGTVHAESPGPGQGSTFTVRLPVKKSAPLTVSDSGTAEESTARR